VGFSETRHAPLRRREVAQPSVTVIFNLGPPLLVGGRDEPLSPRASFAAASLASYGLTEFAGRSSGVELNLTPLGAHAVFGVPMSELSPVVVSLEQALGAGADELTDRLADAPGWASRFDLLDRELTRRIDRRRLPAPDVQHAWQRLVESDGSVAIGALLRELGCSSRHLSARFREQIGVSPKTAARILRFRRSIELLGRDDGRRFAEIATSCGYYDQAHMNREFRDLAGTTPGSFVASQLADGLRTDLESPPQVTSVQDLAVSAA